MDAIIHFTEFLYSALNNKKTCLNILIDYSKAFDNVNHSILLKKLEKYGVRDTPLRFFANYLQNRIQTVNISNASSGPLITNISVPQGSILGPCLFLAYINEIPSISSKFYATMFADDCTLSFAGTDIVNMVSECNRELKLFKQWSDANRLTINVSKTNCLMVSNIFGQLSPGNLFIEDQEIDIVRCVKFLGVFIDNNLKYDEHIKFICDKMSKSIGVIFRIRRLVPKTLLRNIYFSIVQPYIIYCLPIFAATYHVHLEPLILLQKRAIRAINNAAFRAHTDPLFFNNKILKVPDLYKHSLGCYIFKNQHLIDLNSRSHDHFTRNRVSTLIPVARLRATEQSVIRNALLIWNEIPPDIRNCLTFSNFKFEFRKHLLDQYNVR